MERFLDMHMYITSALQKTDMKAVGLQLALDLLHKKVKIMFSIVLYIFKLFFDKDSSGEIICGPEKDLCVRWYSARDLLGAGVLGDGLGTLRDGVFGQFTGEEEPDGGLDLPGGDGGPLVVVGQAGRFGGDTFEDIVDEGVHDAHGLGGHTGIGVDLFQDLVDVDGIRFLTLLGALLIALGNILGGFSGLLGSLS